MIHCQATNRSDAVHWLSRLDGEYTDCRLFMSAHVLDESSCHLQIVTRQMTTEKKQEFLSFIQDTPALWIICTARVATHRLTDEEDMRNS